MLYFAYDELSNWRQMIRAYRGLPPRIALPSSRRAAVLRNFRLCFPRYSEAWSGGIANLADAPGKSVAGALIDLPKRAIELIGRRMEDAGVGIREIVTAPVHPFGTHQAVTAHAHRFAIHDEQHYEPSPRYLSLLISAACELGHSTLWLEHVAGFAAPGRHALAPPVEYGVAV